MIYNIDALREEQMDFWYLELRKQLQDLLQDDAPKIYEVVAKVVIGEKDYLPDMDVKEFVEKIEAYMENEDYDGFERMFSGIALFSVLDGIEEVFNNYLDAIGQIDKTLRA